MYITNSLEFFYVFIYRFWSQLDILNLLPPVKLLIFTDRYVIILKTLSNLFGRNAISKKKYWFFNSVIIQIKFFIKASFSFHFITLGLTFLFILFIYHNGSFTIVNVFSIWIEIGWEFYNFNLNNTKNSKLCQCLNH